MIRVRRAWVHGCPICGGKKDRRLANHITKRREERAWKREWADG